MTDTSTLSAALVECRDTIKQLRKQLRDSNAEQGKLDQTIRNQQREIDQLKFRIAELESRGGDNSRYRTSPHGKVKVTSSKN